MPIDDLDSRPRPLRSRRTALRQGSAGGGGPGLCWGLLGSAAGAAAAPLLAAAALARVSRAAAGAFLGVLALTVLPLEHSLSLSFLNFFCKIFASM